MTVHTIPVPSHGKSLERLPGLLREAGFQGDIANDAAMRAAMSTDNSIYLIVPDLILAPRNAEDVRCLMKLMGTEAFHAIPVTARGGGTGTNGQSLNAGVIVDFQKYMNRLLDVNVEEQWAEVEPGIVLDELNIKLAATGLFFAPTTSTASRCTIGGMVSTDASGKGSRHYGKTSDNVLGLELVLDDGRTLDSRLPEPAWTKPRLEEIEAACRAGRKPLLERVPALSRRFTGYDVERALPEDGALEWWRLPIGAEGTLGLVTRVRLRLRRKPAFKRLVVIGFRNFATALDAGAALLAHDPLAIEVMDEWVQGLAEKAGILEKLPAALRASAGEPIAYNFIEFAGDDEAVLLRQMQGLLDNASRLQGAIASYVAADDAEMAALWNIRAASVGLLGKVAGSRRPIAFVEDCVVPVENLAPFVKDFAALLASHGLDFGMYGHVDVGCLHIRPALDIDREADQAIMKAVSDGVFALTRRYQGIFWGEHGKGVRGAYLADFVGPEAFAAFRRIKHAFDPAGRFNPGKLVSNSGALMGVATTPLRTMNGDENDGLAQAFRCNGNAQCLSYQRSTTMCPSFKATRDLRHSPKGRADALRHWHQAHRQGQAIEALEQEVHAALDGCLGCKACATSCPVQVDIPEMKSHFLERFYAKRSRPLADRLTLLLEVYAPLIARYRKIVGFFSRLAYPLTQRLLGMRDLPAISRSGPEHSRHALLSHQVIASKRWSERTVFIWQDPFTALFDGATSAAVADGLAALGYEPVYVELLSGGKAAHVYGDRVGFLKQAQKLAEAIACVARAGRPMVGVDPAFVMMLRQEYAKAGLNGAQVHLVQEFLRGEVQNGRRWPNVSADALPAKLFLHCSETGAGSSASQDWKAIFDAMGAVIAVQAAGCCGMAGTYGHQKRHQEVSRRVFDLSWREKLDGESGAMVSGFSCRCQVERMTSVQGSHPMQWIADAVRLGRSRDK